jgi:uncharacterized protein (TIGR02118 family)
MAEAKLVVLYPHPKDAAEFERRYLGEHIPMAVPRLTGATRINATMFQDGPQGKPPFHRMAEIYFASADALKTCVESRGGQEAVAHAVEISTGGTPLFIVAEEESVTLSAAAESAA